MHDLTSMQDAKYTIKTVLLLLVAWYLSSLLSDAAFIFLIVNAIMLWPLVYAKKRNAIDSVIGKVNLKVDEIIGMIGILKKLE